MGRVDWADNWFRRSGLIGRTRRWRRVQPPLPELTTAASANRRVALVTGGARRLGAVLVRSLVAHGYDVLLHHGNSAAEARALADALTLAHGVRVEVVQADLQDATAAAHIVDVARQAFGRLDVVVSSASIMERRPFPEVTLADWERAEAVNLRAPFFLLQAAAQVLSDGGVFLQLADHLAHETGWSSLLPHQVTKSALTQLVRAGAEALAPRLRVNAIAPGLVLAPAGFSEAAARRFLRDVPAGRTGTPDDVARAMHFLIDATYVTGVVLPVDGGRHLRR